MRRCESLNAALVQMVGGDAEALLGDGFVRRCAEAEARLRGMTRNRPRATFAAELQRDDGYRLPETVRAVLERREDGVSYYALAMRPA